MNILKSFQNNKFVLKFFDWICFFFVKLAAIKSFCKISVHKYYVVGIKTVVVYVVVAIKCIKRRVFSLHAVRKIFSRFVIVWFKKANLQMLKLFWTGAQTLSSIHRLVTDLECIFGNNFTKLYISLVLCNLRLWK